MINIEHEDFEPFGPNISVTILKNAFKIKKPFSAKPKSSRADNRNGKIQYQGTCRLHINTVLKHLYIKPIDELLVDITATFEWKFIKQKNIIFVFGEYYTQDFALFFNNEGKCSTVFYGIFKGKEKDFVEKEIFQERFLIPIFKKIQQTDSPRLNEIVTQWIHKHDEAEKIEYFQLFNECCKEMNDMKALKQDFDSKLRM